VSAKAAASHAPAARAPRGLAVLVAAYIVLATLFATTIPLWESPDAIWHYYFIAHLAAGHGLPERADEGVDAPWRQQGSQPPLYYVLNAPLVSLVGTSDADQVIRFNPHAAVGVAGPGGNVNRMVHYRRERALPWRGTVLAARLVSLASVLFGLLAVLATWALAREVFPDRPAVPLATAGLLAFNPEFLFFSGSISNDIAIAAAGALVLWRAAVVLRRGTTARNCVWLGVACGLALLTKLSGLWLLPAAAGAVAWAVWRAGAAGPGRERRPGCASRRAAAFAASVTGWSRSMLRPTLGVAAPLLLVSGWWYLRNWMLFGDPTGLPLMLSVMHPRELPPTWRELLVQLGAVWRSYWAVFGWFNIPAPDWVYVAVTALTLIGLGGLGTMLARRRLARSETEGVALAVASVALMISALISWAQVRYPQGRLFFPAAPALSLLIAAGWTAGWSERAGMRVAAGISGGLGVAAMALLVGVIWPTYAPPTWVRSGLSEIPTPIATFGRQLALHTIRVQTSPPASPVIEKPSTLASPGPSAAKPGDILGVELVWSQVGSIPVDYSIFLHVTGEDDSIVAQRDSFPASGNGPTRDWVPGAYLVDRHSIRIDPTAPAPCGCRLILGLYDHRQGRRLLTEDGQDHIDLGPIRIKPIVSPDGIPNPMRVPFGDDIVLAGYKLDRRAAQAGEAMPLTLYWKADRTPPLDYKVSIQLRRGPDEIWAQRDEQPVDGNRSTSEWVPGEVVEDFQPVPIYPEAPPGEYTIYIKLYDRETGQALPVNLRDFEFALGSFKVLPAASTAPLPRTPDT